MDSSESGYTFSSPDLNAANLYLLPIVLSELARAVQSSETIPVFELGCGNGAVANELTKVGYNVTGIDASEQGITHAKANYKNANLFQRSVYDDLAEEFGVFPVVVSLEVVEHLFFPRKYAATLFSLVEPGGTAIVTTPYHGYLKNVALSVSGQLDKHFTALWDYGHIKFWSVSTLTTLLEEAGFVDVRFRFVGRVSFLAKSMVAIARRPSV